MNETELMDMKQASEYVGRTRLTINRWIKEGRLIAYVNDVDRRRKLFRREDLDRLLELRVYDPAEDERKKSAA